MGEFNAPVKPTSARDGVCFTLVASVGLHFTDVCGVTPLLFNCHVQLIMLITAVRLVHRTYADITENVGRICRPN